VVRDYLIEIKLLNKLFNAYYEFLTKNSVVYYGGAVELWALSDDSKLFIIMCAIFENFGIINFHQYTMFHEFL